MSGIVTAGVALAGVGASMYESHRARQLQRERAQQQEKELKNNNSLKGSGITSTTKNSPTLQCDDLLEPIKTDLKGIALEAKDYIQKNREYWQAEFEKETQDESKREVLEQDPKAVEDVIFNQAKATGVYTDEVARVNARLYSTIYATMASRAGMTASDLYHQYGARVTGGIVPNEHAGFLQLDENNTAYHNAIEAVIKDLEEDEKAGVFPAVPYDNDPKNTIPLGTTPTWLTRVLGLDKDIDVSIHKDVIYKSLVGLYGAGKRFGIRVGNRIVKRRGTTANSHKIQVDDLKKLPAQFNDPVMVVKGRYDDTLVILTTLTEPGPGQVQGQQKKARNTVINRKVVDNRTGDEPVVITLHVNKERNKYTIVDITSVHGRGKQWITSQVNTHIEAKKQGKKHIVYADKKRATEILSYLLVHSSQDKIEIGSLFDNVITKEELSQAGNNDVLKQGVISKGSFNPIENTIRLGEHADFSTFAHEQGHAFLHMMSELSANILAKKPVAEMTQGERQIVEDMHTILKWGGVKDLDAWRNMSLDEQRELHEKFARGFEAYLFEGKSPSSELNGVFHCFSPVYGTWFKFYHRI